MTRSAFQARQGGPAFDTLAIASKPGFPRFKILVVDLDDTLWNWFETWHASFSAMLAQLAADNGVDEELLKDEIREVHRKHGTSEYSNTIRELSSLTKLHGSAEAARENNQAAVNAYRMQRNATLRLFPGVEETLKLLRSRGCRVVAYSDSLSFYAIDRLRHTGLDGVIDVLYTPPDHEPPKSSRARTRSEDAQLDRTMHRALPAGVRKPSSKVLLQILADEGFGIREALYVGDSLTNDIRMANDANVTCALVAYKKVPQPDEYSLLQAVSHWSDEKIQTEIDEHGTAIPDHVLHNGFSEILGIGDFGAWTGPPTDPSLDRQVEVWKTVVSVQQHFNDLEMKLRSFAVTILAALFTAAAVAVREGASVPITGSWDTSLGSAILVIAILVWWCFYYIDGRWYHPLLKAAVAQGTSLEAALEHDIPGIGLAGRITAGSNERLSVFKKPRKRASSTRRLFRFYGIVTVVIVFAAWGAHVAGTSAPATPSPEELVVHLDPPVSAPSSTSVP